MNKKLKLLLVSHTFLPEKGGQEDLVHSLGTEFSKKYHTTIATITNNPYGIAMDQRYPYQTVRCPVIGPKPINLITGPFLFVPCIQKLIKEESFNTLHLFEPFTLGSSVLFLKSINTFKFILTLIGVNTYDPYNVNYLRFRKYIRFVMKNADIVTASTEELAYRARAQGYTGEIRIIPHCIDTDRFKPSPNSQKEKIRGKNGISIGDPMIFSLQRLFPRKKVEVIIYAAKIVLSEMPDAKFLIGGTGPDFSRLENLIQKFSIDKSVKLLGYIPDNELPHYFSAADVFAFHTLYEGFGIVAIEAMSCGTPIITTNVGGLKEIVENNNAGVVVPPNNPSVLADALLQILEDSSLRHKLSKNARNAALKKYQTGVVAKQYIDLYNE